MTANPDVGQAFDHWELECAPSGSNPICNIQVTLGHFAKAVFSGPRRLDVVIQGVGSVASVPAGISCGNGTPNDCFENYNLNQNVQLTATPGPNATFVNWLGDCAGTNPVTNVVMTKDKACTAVFQQTFTLTITKGGTGTGTVTSAPPGINCGADCSEIYNAGTVVGLTPTPIGTALFAGWDATSDPDCNDASVTMNADKTCKALFNVPTVNRTLTVVKAGTGQGSITGPGINCGNGTPGDCTEIVNDGTNVNLIASAAGGSGFANWTNCDVPAGNQCTMNMTGANKTVTATFTLGGGSFDVNLHFRDKCGGGVIGVWAYITEGHAPEEQVSPASGEVTFTNVSAPYTVTFGWDDPNPANTDRLDTFRITDGSKRDITRGFDTGPASCTGKYGTGTANVSGAVNGTSLLDFAFINALPAGGGNCTNIGAGCTFANAQVTNLPDDGSTVPYALYGWIPDLTGAPEPIKCIKGNLGPRGTIKTGDILTNQDITVNACTPNKTANFTFASDFTGYYEESHFAGLKLDPEGFFTQWLRAQSFQSNQALPGFYNITLPTGQTGLIPTDMETYTFRFNQLIDARVPPGEPNDDIYRFTSWGKSIPVPNAVDPVTFMPGADFVSPPDDFDNTKPAVSRAVPFTWSFTSPGDPAIVVTNIEIFPSGNPSTDVWGVHLQGNGLTAFTLPDLSTTTLKPAVLGLSGGPKYMWRLSVEDTDFALVIGGTPLLGFYFARESGMMGWVFKTQ